MLRKLSLSFIFCMVATMFLWVPLHADGSIPKVTGLKQIGATENTITVSWNAITSNPGIEVQLSDSKNNFSKGQTTKIGLQTNHQFTFGLNPNSVYYVRVRAYTRDTGGYSYGEFSDILTCHTSPSAISGSISQTATAAKSVTIKWTASKGSPVYCVYLLSDTEQRKKVGETKNASYTFTNLSPGKTYTAYVSIASKSGDFVTESSLKSAIIKTSPGKLPIAATEWNQTFREITFEWNVVENADGYQLQIFNYKGKRVKNLNGITLKNYPSPKNDAYNLTGNNKALCVNYKPSSNKAGFTYRTRAYTFVEGNRVYGAWSNKAGLIASPTMKSTRSKNNKTATLKWNKIKGARSYSIYRTTSPLKKYKKVATVKKNKYIMKKLKKKQHYYLYVVANQKVGKKTYSSKSKIVHFMRVR